MGEVVSVPLHLAVHVTGFTVTAGIAGFAAARRRSAGWQGLVLGGFLLAAAHVLDGGVLVGDATWPLYLRAAGYAAFAVGAAGRVVGAAAVAAVPVGVNVIAAVTGLLAAVATRGGVLGRGRQVAGLTAGLVLWAVSDLLAVRWEVAAGVASLIGSLSAGAWLVSRLRSSLAARLSVVFGAVLLAVVVLLASVSAFAFSADLRADRLDALQRLASGRASATTAELPATLGATTRRVAGAASVVEALRSGETLDRQAEDLVGLTPRSDLGLFIDASGTAVGSYDRRNGAPLGPRETALAGSDPVRLALERQQSVQGLLRLGVDSTTGAPELLAVSVEPVFAAEAGADRRDLLIGAVLVGTRVASDQSLTGIVNQTGVDVVVVVGNEVANATLDLTRSQARELVAAASGPADVVSLAGRATFVVPATLTDYGSDPVATLVLVEDASTVAALQERLARALFLAAAIGTVVAALAASVVAGRTTRPLRRLTVAAEEIEAGDLSTRVDETGEDEVGRLGGAFNLMAGSLQRRQEDLLEAADTERRLRSRLEAITESMNEALIAVDPAGRITTANPVAARLFETSSDALLGRPVDTVLAGTGATGGDLLDALGRTSHDGAVALRGQLTVPSRPPVDVVASAAPLTDDRGRVYVLRDITGEAQAERMKTEFISNISHELRTPLTPVKAYAALLASRPDMPREKLEVVSEQLQTSSAQLERIIDMLVTFAALEAGRIGYAPQELDLVEVIDERLSEWATKFPDREFIRYVTDDTPHVVTDPDLLAQVLDELLDNARKFSTDQVDVRAEPDVDGWVTITVADRGDGIPPEAIADLSRDFHQVDGSATRHFGGLGLGLAIVERTLLLLGGQLTIESDVGQGTHARIHLPVAH